MNMWFKKKEKQPQDEIAPSAPMDGEVTDESKAKDLKRIDADIIYPSGLKLSDNLYSRRRRTCTSHVHGSRAL